MKHSYEVTTGEQCSLWPGLDPGAQNLLTEEAPRSQERVRGTFRHGGSPGRFRSRVAEFKSLLAAP